MAYILIVCAVLLVVGTAWLRVRTRRLAASRPGENFDSFCASFESGKVPPEVLRAVNATFQEWCSDTVPAFPVRADDDIGRIYGMVDEDLDDAVMDTLAACGRQLPVEEQLRRMQPVHTVRDFACLIAACPEARDHSAHARDDGSKDGNVARTSP